MEVRVGGTLVLGVTPKDVVLAIIGKIGAAGGTGYVIEYTGSVFRDMSVEGRLTVSNMSIVRGATAGLIAPDEKTFAYLKGRKRAPKGELWEKAVEDRQSTRLNSSHLCASRMTSSVRKSQAIFFWIYTLNS